LELGADSSFLGSAGSSKAPHSSSLILSFSFSSTFGSIGSSKAPHSSSLILVFTFSSTFG